MIWKIADELYTLSRKVLKETNYSIHFEINERAIYVWIKKNGNGTGFDGVYDIYNKDTMRELSLDNYEMARKHLERLLKENV